MSVEIFMPRLGLTMKEGTITKWLKKEGETVTKGEMVAELTTEKIVNSIEAPEDGVLEKIICQEGETIDSGMVIGYITKK